MDGTYRAALVPVGGTQALPVGTGNRLDRAWGRPDDAGPGAARAGPIGNRPGTGLVGDAEVAAAQRGAAQFGRSGGDLSTGPDQNLCLGTGGLVITLGLWLKLRASCGRVTSG
ncbi:hypothetical protein [Streptacidiphilus sp. P02-A3a]|uniref:hypothetical protein n=1 Tax=Streptacidiphilus sp. P02-A3a TaxID=2704468 RepID=UPI0015FB1242|nr:hypothetical protein [Streptacidiphilus sp. P02-A3a]QMU70230.1 hypothetical protein GXP74_20430 [Streptacidiphilus sp. P02-A3a]QMU70314.1 hypothetical protein GXP74_20945 [Streptacidiphilus sp. P02-A3a]